MAQPFRYVEKSVVGDVAAWLRHDGGGRMVHGRGSAIHLGDARLMDGAGLVVVVVGLC